MRATFINTLFELAKEDSNIVLLSGDMGFSVVEEFRKAYPNRFYNVGIAEANMAGIAAGLAMKGKKVFLYSIIPFVTARCYEQIKVDICYHKLPVTIVGVGGGVSYGSQGSTHHSLDDIAIMRALPEMKVFCPSDPFEAGKVIRSIIKENGPSYVRLGKSNDPYLFEERTGFNIYEAYIAKEGTDATIVATGNMVEAALGVSKILKEKGISLRVVSMHCIKPLDENMIRCCIRETGAIFSLEEHSVIGGLGSAVAEVIAESSERKPFKRFGIPDTFIRFVGDQKHIRERFGLVEKKIAEEIREIIR